MSKTGEAPIKRQPLLPRERKQDRPLIWILTIMALFAGLTLLLTLMSFRAADIWQADLSGQATVQIFGGVDAAYDEISERAAAVLRADPEISAVTPLTQDRAESLLEPWIGTVALPEDITIPVVLSIKSEPGFPVNPTALTARLERAGLKAEIDDHQRWSGQLKKTAQTVQISMALMFVLVLTACIGTSIFATQAAMATHNRIVSVLTQVGAKDGFISRLFLRRFFFLGLISGILGAIWALIFVFCIQVLGSTASAGEASLLGQLSLTWDDVIKLAVLPIILGLISALSASYTSRSLLNGIRQAQ